ncbi:MAG TPA: redoxin domain-containing protein [Sphingobacteriaceae bacterium]|nr:redoxin domain-containing protein [Sphingobacteriaceae bacterium]
MKAGNFVKSFLTSLALIVFLVQSCTSQTPTNAPKNVPEFTFFTLKGNKTVTRTNLALQGNIVFIFFDPGCSHCRTDMKGINDNFDEFNNANFYLVSQHDPMLVTDFLNTYAKDIQNKANVHVLLDKNYEFLVKFQPRQYPALYVYGPDRTLKSFLEGGNPIGKILEAVNK